jgi:hypothetical protein
VDQDDVPAGHVDEGAFMDAVEAAVRVAAESGLPHAFIGGLASVVLARPRWTHDIDLFVRPEDAHEMLEGFDAAGFATEERDDWWLFKAVRDGVLVDVIFRVVGPAAGAPVELDEGMLGRVRTGAFKGIELPVIGPEDLLVLTALVHKERRSRHWFDALALVSGGGLDWGYLSQRARCAPHRVLSLLLYARSDGLDVPDRVLSALLEQVGLGGTGGEEAYAVARVREELARDIRTAELEVDVRLDGDDVVLSGQVATPERRAALEQVVGLVLPGRPVRNLTTTAVPAAEPVVEHLS